MDPFAPQLLPSSCRRSSPGLCGRTLTPCTHSLTGRLLWVRALGHDLPWAPGTPPSLWTPCPQPDTQTDFRWASDEGSQGARDEDEASREGGRQGREAFSEDLSFELGLRQEEVGHGGGKGPAALQRLRSKEATTLALHPVTCSPSHDSLFPGLRAVASDMALTRHHLVHN